MDLVDELLKKEVVTINEVGSGVIPDDPILRAKREATGRVGAALAERATKVVRMVAGIPMVIKDETK
jgi:adenosylcobinamide kinase/adenosylcobinamide-phosphate guanylyltransferase